MIIDKKDAYVLIHELPMGATAAAARDCGFKIQKEIPDNAIYRKNADGSCDWVWVEEEKA